MLATFPFVSLHTYDILSSFILGAAPGYPDCLVATDGHRQGWPPGGLSLAGMCGCASVCMGGRILVGRMYTYLRISG